MENPFGEPLQVAVSVGRTAAPVAVFLMQPSCPFIGQLGWFFLCSEVSRVSAVPSLFSTAARRAASCLSSGGAELSLQGALQRTLAVGHCSL